ncbi:hypothetical protein [Actinomyces provencensis]|uniref:hypothetical protein n=1 Tax=Actinomyces provencensis TaxID=1720198 RepID=UPI0012B5DD38|nr:hypothetical protein [Actinomyces provencensis]
MDSDPAREALTVTLAAVVAGVAVGALTWGVIITIQLTRLLHVLTLLAEALANQPL